MALEIDERVKDEIEALEAILMDDVTIQYDADEMPKSVTTIVFPSTADDTNQQYVCVTLEVTLTTGYPESEPQVKLKNPRGLDDATIDLLNQQILNKCQEFVGQSVIFELIELIREKLTNSNVPSCQCAVCLYGFKQGDQFTKTECYHYFHAYCLACHLINTERLYIEEQDKLPAWQKTNKQFQPTCPVCREAIRCDLESLKTAPPPLELENAQQFEATSELRALQAQMAKLYLYQQNRGGIIDVEADESKLLLVTGAGDETSEDEQPSDIIQSVIPPGPSIRNTNHSRNETQQNKPVAPKVVKQVDEKEEQEDDSRRKLYRGYNRNGRRGRDRHSRYNSSR